MDGLRNDPSGLSFAWPAEGVTRVPYQVYFDPNLYALEQERIFRGPVWSYLAITDEIPEPGDFTTTHVGEAPVIVCRDRDGKINAFVNRCSHRGSLVTLEKSGNRKVFTCPYHNWSFDQQGGLVGVPFRNGVKGVGGMPESFDLKCHGLQTLRVDTFNNVIFGTFSDQAPPLHDFLGPAMRKHLNRVFNGRKMKVIGRFSQYQRNNWKLYMENVRDPYHASILHLFFGTFGLSRMTMKGGTMMDDTGMHHFVYSYRATDDIRGSEYEGNKIPNMKHGLQLNDPSLLDEWPEFSDGITNTVQTIFPSVVFMQITNVLGVRHLVPRGPEECELYWILMGYEDDTPEQTAKRLKQANLVGPAGYIALEDGAVTDFVQRAARVDGGEMGVVELGGHGVESTDQRATETAVRGLWKVYREMMGF